MSLGVSTNLFYRYLCRFFIGESDNRYMMENEIECHQGNDDDVILSGVGSENGGNLRVKVPCSEGGTR